MTKIAIVELTDENRKKVLEVALSAYIGERCVFCGKIAETIKDLNAFVYAPSGIAHKDCWDKAQAVK